MAPLRGLKKRLGFRSKKDKSVAVDEVTSPSPLPADEISTTSLASDLATTAIASEDDLHSYIPRERQESQSSQLSTSSAAPKDPLGLTAVHIPTEAAKADIIFIHGLGGTSRMTWSKNKNVELFWPERFLPLERDICLARIFTYGYNADVFKSRGRSTMSVLDLAKDLLYELKYARDDVSRDLKIGELPLIFVAHSMGGLIVKEAYLQGQIDPEFEQVVKAVTAILFMSTPHRGTNLAETLNRILQVSFLSPKGYIGDLNRNSFTLQKINEQFRHVAPKLDIISFYETQPTAIGISQNRILVLEKDSSILGYPGEVSKALDADHHSICKYDSPKDPRYMNVRDYLKKLLIQFVTLRSSRASEHTNSALALTLRELEAALSITEPADTDFIFFRDRWTSGTCEWITEDKLFDQWVSDSSEDPRLLWLHGSAGCGKSVLTSFVINHLVEKTQPCHYYFFRSSDQGKKSLGNMLRSLALQIASTFPAFRLALSKITPHLRLRGANPRLIWEKVFKSILFKLDFDGPMFWTFDGLDECDSPREGIRLLADVLETSVPIRILVTSRQDAEIGAEVRKLSQGAMVSTLMMRENLDDYRLFLKQELEWSDVPAFNARISQRLIDMAQGNFLWLRLTVDRINKCHTEADVANALRQLPDKMEQLYDHMADSIARQSPSDQALTNDIVTWATCVLRNISVAELSEALNPDHSRFINLQRCIHDLCRGFVVVDNGETVAMVHQTAREYLLGSKNRPFNIDKKVANEKLFLRCLKCLTTQNLRGALKRGDYPLLLPYAISSWGGHLLSSNPGSDTVVKMLRHFLGSTSILIWVHAVAQFNQFHLLLQASNYLSRFALHLKNHYSSSPSPHQLESDLLLVEGWATELGKLAGKFGKQLLQKPDSIYEMIPPFCPEGSMIRKQFSRKGTRGIVATGLGEDWDDSLARLSLPHGYEAHGLAAQGDWIVVAAALTTNNISTVFIYHSSSYQEARAIKLGQRLRSMKLNRSGSLLVTSCFSSTDVWNVTSGDCIANAPNPPGRPRPKDIAFSHDDESVILATDDHKVWTMKVDKESSFELVTRLTESGNSPSCMSFSPDGKQVALGARQRPLSIWTTKGSQLVARCNELTRVSHIVWHPYSGELFGVMMHVSGKVFKWHPDSQGIMTSFLEVSRIVISSDGKLLTVGNQYGNIRLLSTEDLSVVYQLDSQDPVLGLAFSFDTRQLYDIRETYGNVWEPNVLLKLSELAAPLTDDDSDIVHSDRLELDPTPGSYYTRIDPITSLAVQKQGHLYCSGTFSGAVSLFDTEEEGIVELGRSRSFSIQQMAWSDDGMCVCYADVSRTIFVHSISPPKSPSPPTAERILELSLRSMKDNINQLIFHPTEPKILISSCTAATIVSVDDKIIITAGETPSQSGKWMKHPTETHLLLFVSNAKVDIFSWENLSQIISIPLLSAHIPPKGNDVNSSDDISRSLPSPSGDGFADDDDVFVEHLLLSESKRFLILQNSRPGYADKIRILDIASLRTQGIHQSVDHQIFDIPVPEVLNTMLSKPLAVLSDGSGQDTLIFLDLDSWLCTWAISLDLDGNFTTPFLDDSLRQLIKTGVETTRRGEQTEASIALHRHYCLPGDWVSPDCLALLQVFDNGAVLCPRNGELAIVQCNTLLG